MIWEITKYSLIALVIWVLYDKVIRETLTMYKLKGRGVVYMPGFPPVTDLGKFLTEMEKDKGVVPLTEVQYTHISNPLPDFTAIVLFGTTIAFINKAELLEDVYVKKNMYYTKAWAEINNTKPFFDSGPFV